jgi:hypothetical protein
MTTKPVSNETLLQQLEWRYATKAFDPARKICDTDWSALEAALVGVDTCPMEGFVPEKYDEILDLPAQGYQAVVACAAGYRAASDKYASAPKVRFSSDELVVRI